MQPSENMGENPSGDQSESIVCSQCGAPMPRQMRFCRNCGNRLGEGPAEYTETVLLPNSRATSGRRADPFQPQFNSPMMRGVTGEPPYRRRRAGGMIWIVAVIAILFMGGGLLSVLKKQVRPVIGTVFVVRQSYFGVNGFENTDGGVTFDRVEPPDSPADKAGLVGGDIITKFNGVEIEDSDQIMQMLRDMPAHTTADITYIRDGQTKQTQLTTVSEAEFNELRRLFDRRPQGIARLGFETGDAHRVEVPGMNIYGVQLEDFNSNGPAALAGLEKGDIIIQMDDVPIRTPGEFIARIHRAIPYTTVKFTVIRGSQKLEIPVKLGK